MGQHPLKALGSPNTFNQKRVFIFCKCHEPVSELEPQAHGLNLRLTIRPNNQMGQDWRGLGLAQPAHEHLQAVVAYKTLGMHLNLDRECVLERSLP